MYPHIEPRHVLSVSIEWQAVHEVKDDLLGNYVIGDPSAEIAGRRNIP